MRYLFISVLALTMLSGFLIYSYAGNQNNSQGAGNVTAAILCEFDNDLTVDHSQITIRADGCNCALEDAKDGFDITAADCSGNEKCAECLANLQTAGLTIISTTSFLDPINDVEDMQFVLTGTTGPFITRNGGCPCP